MSQETLLAYIGAIIAVAVAGSMAIHGSYAPASVMAAGAAFLIYWARRDQGRGGP